MELSEFSIKELVALLQPLVVFVFLLILGTCKLRIPFCMGFHVFHRNPTTTQPLEKRGLVFSAAFSRSQRAVVRNHTCKNGFPRDSRVSKNVSPHPGDEATSWVGPGVVFFEASAFEQLERDFQEQN